ncbi:hypothetical protein V8G54_017076 [Vigna mungo]|uniref:Uncharacterized protein n=1 Tax=Vigna mungo TaxID=3915 RepID=A0AAQ3NP81_VIGMU
MRYSDSQTETQDSSLTHMYDHHGSAYFGDQQDLKAIAGFQAFSTNSGSEVDDSASIGKGQPSEFGTHSIESSGNEFAAFSGTDGQVDMKRIYGTTVAGGRVKPGKGVKVYLSLYFLK